MKTLFTIPFAFCFAFLTSCEEPINPQPVTNTETLSINGANFEVTHFSSNNHLFISWKRIQGDKGYFAVVHDPDCPCAGLYTNNTVLEKIN